MRNTRFGDVRPTSRCLPYPLRSTRARGAEEPLTSARAIEIASEIGGAFHVLCPRRGREGARRASA